MKIATERAVQEAHRKNRIRAVFTVILRILLALFTAVLVVAVALLGVIFVFEKGPSRAARNIFCITCLETSALKWVPNIFLSDAEVAEIASSNSIISTEELTNTDLVQIPDNTSPNSPKDENVDPDGDGIDIFDIKGSTYIGKMMVVYDPSRVFVGTSGEFGLDKDGKEVKQMCKNYGAVAGINAGGFIDQAGNYRGGMPLGVVISEGELLNAEPESAWDMVGITNENKLICGYMTVQSALDREVRDAVYFGPSLIINGEPREQLGSGSGLNPRAAIGQRADGAILLMVIDGRQANSLGASLVDVRNEMEKFGAVNAYNLDGGSSTTMVYNGETINQSALLLGFRNICTSILVRDKE
ncbi:MAG: phosphodiester glycosidase family protein [Oscillospiraceae bacterium]